MVKQFHQNNFGVYNVPQYKQAVHVVELTGQSLKRQRRQGPYKNEVEMGKGLVGTQKKPAGRGDNMNILFILVQIYQMSKS